MRLNVYRCFERHEVPSSTPHLSSELWVAYLTLLPECSTGISHLTCPKWISWSSPTNFHRFQPSHFCIWLHHPSKSLNQKLGSFPWCLPLPPTANSPCPIDSTPFFWNLGTSLAQVLSPSPQPLPKAAISLPVSSPPLSPPSSISPHPLPTHSPAESVHLTAARAVFQIWSHHSPAPNDSGFSASQEPEEKFKDIGIERSLHHAGT